ncbi:MAG: aspartate aminotransferase family protein [Clostridiales bacterium]|nr:aspartate aminotransferase family protein [Clostridiales bacterium]
MENIIKTADDYLMQTYKRFQIVLDKGEGLYLYDINGKKYLDFASGIGVYSLGYANKEYNESLKKQIDKLLHTSNLFYNAPATEAAEKLARASAMNRVFFTNSGAEAVEGAIKLARKYYYKKYGKADSEIIAMENSFHGRTMGALSVTGTKKYREAFEPLIAGVKFAEFNNLESVISLVNDKTCAILMEPIQGEGGLHPASEEFINGIKKICDEKGILLIFDEIQCGMGRTGTMFAYEQYKVKPDIITCAKALGCGVPVGAFAAREEVAGAFDYGDHGTTYGGNPFATAAVSKVFDLYKKENVLSNVNETGIYLNTRLDELAKKHKSIIEHRGRGLMQGLEFDHPVADIISKAMDKGLIIISAGSNVIRFLPPLVINKEHVDEMADILEEAINE